MKKLFLFFLLMSLAVTANALKPEDLLKPDEAFQLSTEAVNSDTVRATWKIAKGYYLYRSKFGFESANNDIALKTDAIQYPKGKEKDDPNFGRMEIYYDEFSVDIPLTRGAASRDAVELALKTKYQGCADIGLCYPPQRKEVTLQLAALDGASANTAIAEATSNANPVLSITGASATSGNGSNGGTLSDLFGADAGGAMGEPLPVEQAFQFDLSAIDRNTLKAHWAITPDHHLYRSKIKFTLKDAQGDIALGQAQFPQGKIVDDEFFGKMEVYGAPINVTIPVEGNAQTLIVETEYQGCSDTTGICYPPVRKTTELSLASLPAGTSSAAASSAAASGNASADEAPAGQNAFLSKLNSASFLGAVFFFFIIGVGLAFTPCILPMIPILSGIIVGQSNLSTRKAFLISLVYVTASASTYAVIGVIFGLFGDNLQTVFQHPVAISLFAALFVLLALSMFGFYELQMPNNIQTRLNDLSNNQRGGSFVGAAVMGFLSTLIVGPCVAPPLAGALTYIAQSKDALLGGMTLFAMGFGMGIPLLLVGASAGHLLPRAGTWMDTVKAIFGILMIGVAIWLLDRIVPAQVTMALAGTLLVASGIYMGALDRMNNESGGWARFWKSLGLIMLFYGAALFFGIFSGTQSLLNPLKGVFSGGGSYGGAAIVAPVDEHYNFRKIKTTQDLDNVLAEAQNSNKTVILDFYADWCVDCVRMEKNTFTAAGVQTLMDNMIALQADVTKNDAEDKALLQRFGIIGPPTIVFFRNQQELNNHRLIGYENAEEFTARLQKIESAL